MTAPVAELDDEPAFAIVRACFKAANEANA
jgi:hypothetical protein